jgi:BirA family biotin operon repressor/biotin-[acetyl-CoA-carboxylase] ligase
MSRLPEPPAGDPVTVDRVVPLLLDLVGSRVPWVAGVPYEYLPTCASTNTVLKGLAESAASGTTVVTDEQTGGRGRVGRTWMSEPGRDLTFSVLIRPSLLPAQGHLLSLAGGVAVAEVLEERCGRGAKVGLKWPNDVLLDGKKVCGILLEASADPARIHWAVAGIGLNVNSESSSLVQGSSPGQAAEWKGRLQPVSLREHLGRMTPRAPLLAALLARLTYWWNGLGRSDAAAGVLAEWERRDVLEGRRVEVSAGMDDLGRVAVGEAAGIGEEGQLLVRRPDGTVMEIFAGDVSVAM